MGQLISDKFTAWQAECEARFQQLKANEEELNRIFIDIYGLQDELTPEVADKDVTVHRIFNTKDDVPESMKGSNYVRTLRDEIVSLLSYAVGCLFGRYSLDVEGLAYAGGEWDASKYQTIIPDADNILPICDDDYFEDDLTGKFVDFVRVVYGEDTLEENLKFIADALGGKGTSRRSIVPISSMTSSKNTVKPTKSGPSTGCLTAERKTASRPSSTSTAIRGICWPGCAPTTSTNSRNATAPSSPTWPIPWNTPPGPTVSA